MQTIDGAAVTNEQVHDFTRALEFLANHMLAPGCKVVLKAAQFETLKYYLSRIESLGDDVNFRLETCVDHACNHDVLWTSNGSEEQDHAVAKLMDELVSALAFEDRDGGV